jgi:hypothetical protein
MRPISQCGNSVFRPPYFGPEDGISSGDSNTVSRLIPDWKERMNVGLLLGQWIQ